MVRYEEERVRRRRNSITTAEIVAVARGIVGSQGADALTVRAVATAMGSAPMSLYNHFRTKEAMLDAVLDQVLGELAFDDEGGEWTAELERYGLALAEHLAAHPWAVLPIMARPDPGEAATALGEKVIGIALRGGLSPALAVTAFSTIIALVYGRAAFLAAALLPGAQRAEEVTARIDGADAADFPATASVAEELAGYAGRQHLERGLRALIGGLARE